MNHRPAVIFAALVTASACSGASSRRGVAPAVATAGSESADSLIMYAPGVVPAAEGARVLGQGFVVAEAQLLVAAEVPADSCMRYDVGMSAGVEDADLVIYGADGRPLAIDEATDRFAATVVCTAPRIVIHARVLAARGAGEMTLLARSVPRDSIRRLGFADAAVSTGRSGPDEALRRRAVDALVPRGFRVEAGPIAVDLASDVPTHVGVTVRVGECVVVQARGESHELGLRLTTAAGDVLADDSGSDRDLGVSFCSVDGQPLSASLVAEESARVYVIVLRGLARDVGGASSIAVGRNETAGERSPPAVMGP